VNSYSQNLLPTCKAFPKETTCIWFTQRHKVCNSTTVLQEVQMLWPDITTQNVHVDIVPHGCEVFGSLLAGRVVVRLSWSSSMVLAADFGGMPDTLLQKIFSCCTLTVRSKLSCQQVCRSWKECISCTRPAGLNCLWAKRIEIHHIMERMQSHACWSITSKASLYRLPP